MTTPRKKPRRGRGEGSIHYRKSEGRWCGQLSYTVAIPGIKKRRRVRITVYGESKDDVIQAMNEERAKRRQGGVVSPSELTVGEYMERWLTLVAGRLEESTLVDYGRVVRQTITRLIGETSLQKLTIDHVEYMLSEMKTKGGRTPSGRTKQYALQILSTALKAAIRKKLLAANPCDGIEKPKARRRDMAVLDAKQAEEFVRAAERHKLFAIYILALDTGARRGELLALKWSDINWQKATLSIDRAGALINGTRTVIKGPKTAKGRRQITLPQRTMAALRQHQKQQLASGRAGFDWVFCDDDGKHLIGTRITEGFKRILKWAGLPEIRFHDLRHTHASLLFAAGVHPKIVQERLGHATISVTLDIYSHLIPSMQLDIQQQLNVLFA